jgi:hypothetical protein
LSDLCWLRAPLGSNAKLNNAMPVSIQMVRRFMIILPARDARASALARISFEILQDGRPPWALTFPLNSHDLGASCRQLGDEIYVGTLARQLKLQLTSKQSV